MRSPPSIVHPIHFILFSGIRLFDIETLTRIAHIDRPSGARSSLYPTLSALRPTLRFETSHYLVVAWGDCLMGLSITDNDKVLPTSTTGEATSSAVTGTSPKPRRRTVECAMAWELDCVACGVVPLDRDNVLVLGIVTPSEGEDDRGEFESSSNGNDLEVQIISKEDGSVTYSNLLPNLYNNTSQACEAEAASAFTLVSSFALPRMDDAFEAEEEGNALGPDLDFNEFDINVSLFSPTSKSTKPFVDSHLKWNMKTLSFDDEEGEITKSVVDTDDHDTDSVDSNDYGFVFRPLTQDDEDPVLVNTATPPLMIISSPFDAIITKMRDVDDAIAYALSQKKKAVALKRALRWRRRIRRFEISDLVNEYFISLLRLERDDSKEESTNTPLSIRRLKLAARAMPVLFGTDIGLWGRWVNEFEKIPGALFIVVDHIPVRGKSCRPIMRIMLFWCRPFAILSLTR